MAVTPHGRAYLIRRINSARSVKALREWWANNLGDTYRNDPELIAAAKAKKDALDGNANRDQPRAARQPDRPSKSA
ncbi:MAG: hypothetical protein GOVbin2937_81 [Prokaryotic dsDNA virus sp.]|nr:MAG: hypothetical protein GOVbin2937_81 [Prokaryotic dsDNA virus sp.]